MGLVKLILNPYNFDSMTSSDSAFDSRGWFFRDKLSDENIAEIEGLRDVAMATNFGTKIAITQWLHLNDSD